MHACAGADNGGEKRNVLIVSVWLPIAIDLALRSNMPGVSSAHFARVAATPITVMGDVEVEDQAPAARLVS